MARLPWQALILTIVSTTLSLLIILSGVAGSPPFYFLEFNTKDYRPPSSGSQLSSSQYLQDLSTVSGNDLVGSSSGAEQAVHIAEVFQVALLTVCQIDNGATTCAAPSFGYTFEIQQAFHLESDMFAGIDMSAFDSRTNTYRQISLFLVVGYVLGAAFTFTSLVLILLSAWFPRGALLIACITQTLAAVFLLAASITAAVTFYQLGDVLNDTLGRVGIQTTVSWRIMVATFMATLQSWLVLVFLLRFRKTAARRSAASSSSPLHRNVAPSSLPTGITSRIFVAGSGEASSSSGDIKSSSYRSGGGGGAPLGYGLLNKMPTWKRNQQKYTEISKQPETMMMTSPTSHAASSSSHIHHDNNSHDSTRSGLMESNEHQGEDEERGFLHDMPHDDVAQGAVGYNPRDPAARYDDRAADVVPERRKQTEGIHADTAYDPYRR